MSGYYLRLFTAGCFIVISSTVFADEQPIVVTATRTAQIADDSLAPVIIIDREQIEQSQAVDIADVLRNYAGLDIARNGGPGQPVSLFMRGTNSTDVLIMVDGVKVTSGSVGGAPLQNIDPDMIERIEIVKGPRSTLYGSDAVGGVINIITRRTASPGLDYNGYAGAGTYGTYKVGVGAHDTGSDYRTGIDVGYTDSTGFPAVTGSTVKNGYNNTSVNLYGGKRLGQVDAEVRLWQASGLSDYMGPDANFDLTIPVSEDFTNRVASLRLNSALTDTLNTTLLLSQAQDIIDQIQNSDHDHTRRNSVDWQNDLQIDTAQLLTAGLYLEQEYVSVNSSPSYFDQTTDIRAAYAQDNFNLGAHHLLLAMRLSDYNIFGKHTTWDAEYGYRLAPHTLLTASVATAFHAPDADDRFVGYGGNPDLRPEISRNIEIGLHHQLDGRQTLTVSAFDNRIRDLFVYDFTTNQEQNIGLARIRGIETSYDFKARPWGMHVEAIAQNPEDEVTGDQLLRRAKRTLTTSMFYDAGRYRVSANWLLTTKRSDISATDFSNIYDSGHGLLGLTGQVLLNKAWTLQGRVDNLTDQHYTLADGYNTAGRSLFVELRYEHKG